MGSGTGPPLKPPVRPRTKEANCERHRASPRKRGSHSANSGFSFSTAVVSDNQNHFTKPRRCKQRVSIGNESNQANRAISTGKLNALPHLHTRPINVVVYHGSQGRTRFEVGFSLRCIQRLSRPYVATLHCGWRHNSSTRGMFIPVLSY